MISTSANGPRTKLVDMAAHLAVGEYVVMVYGDAKSCITLLRALKDGRKWSLQPAPVGHDDGDYAVWRCA